MPNIDNQNEEINNRLQEETAEQYEDMQDAMGNYVGPVTSQVVNMDTIDPAAITHDLLSKPIKNNPKFDFSDFQEDARKNEKKASEMVNKLPKKAVAKPKSSINELLKKHEDQIAMLLYLTGGAEPEALSKEARELFLQYTKEVDNLKDKFIDLVQKM